jgi:hypothetical protein
MYQDRMVALGGAPTDYVNNQGRDLLARWDCHQAYCDLRTAQELAPYWKTSLGRIETTTRSQMRDGHVVEGVYHEARSRQTGDWNSVTQSQEGAYNNAESMSVGDNNTVTQSQN